MKNWINKIKAQLQGYDFFDTLKHTSTYFTATLLINALGIISLPVYTSFLEIDEFGIVEAFNQAIKLLAVIMTLNAHQAVGRYYFEEKKDWREFLGSSLITTFSVFVLVSLLVFSFRKPLLHYWNIPPDLFYWVFPATLSLVILMVFNLLFVARKESFLVSKGQVLFSYARFIGAVVFLFWLTPAYFGRVVGDVLMSVVLAGYLFYKIYPHVRWVFSKEHLRYIVTYCLPLVPFSISGFLLLYFDLFMINSADNQDAGLYAFAYKIGLLFMGLDQALQNAAKPEFFKWMNAKNFEAITSQVKSIMKFEVIGSVFLILFAFDIGSVLASKAGFKASLHLVPIIVLSYVFFGAYNFYARLIIYSKKTIYISLITIAGGALNIVLNSKYIPQFGYEIAAYTTLVSYIAMLLMGWITIVWIMKLPPPPFKDILVKISGVVLILILSHYLYQIDIAYILNLFLRLLIFAGLFLLLFWSKIIGVFRNDEI